MEKGDIRVHVILLDNRYHMNPDTWDIFGEEQFSWLEYILAHTQANVTLICSGIQVLPERKYFTLEEFQWKNKQRLFSHIKSIKKPGVIFLSGDVHFAQTYQTRCSSLTGYNLLEVTSSGMTHTAFV